jgi:hypothetical protein
MHGTQLAVCVVRTRKGRVKLAGEIDIVRVPARAGDKPPVFTPEDRLSNTELT